MLYKNIPWASTVAMFRLFQEILREFQSVKNKAHVNAFPYIAILFPPHPPAGNVLPPASAQVLFSCRPSGRFRDRSAERKAMRIACKYINKLKKKQDFLYFYFRSVSDCVWWFVCVEMRYKRGGPCFITKPAGILNPKSLMTVLD